MCFGLLSRGRSQHRILGNPGCGKACTMLLYNQVVPLPSTYQSLHIGWKIHLPWCCAAAIFATSEAVAIERVLAAIGFV